MKNSLTILTLSIILCSCQNYLDIMPDNVATIEYAFRDRMGAEKFLFTCYAFMPAIGHPASDPGIMSGDEWWPQIDQYWYASWGNFDAFYLKRGEQNVDNPMLNYWDGARQGRGLFAAIRYCNDFIDNVFEVGPDLSYSEKMMWSAEAKFIKAFYHFYLLRMYGPIPLMKVNQPVFSGVNDVRIYREPFEECVDYIVQLLDEAIEDLPLTIQNQTQEMGRVTQPVAASIKAMVLVTAASPLFVNNEDLLDMKDNRDVYLFRRLSDDEVTEKWRIAAQACKEAIDICAQARMDLYEFTALQYGRLSDTTKLVMTLRHAPMDKWNREIIWGNARNTANDLQRVTLPYLASSWNGGWDSFLAPTFRMAELFYSNHGVPIDEDRDYYARSEWYQTDYAPEDHYYYIPTGQETAKLHFYREPRFYANIAFDGGYWFGNGRFRDVGEGTPEEQPWVVRMKRGEPAGKVSSMRYSMTGYWSKKAVHYESTVSGTTPTFIRTSYPIMRLADLYLLYAEALNESLPAPNAEVYQYIDLIRERAGLEGVVESWQKYSRIAQKPLTKTGMRDIIQQERMIELAFESKRFWDLRRWKKTIDQMNQHERKWNVDGTTAADYYNVQTLATQEFTSKEYLWPIRQSSIRTNSNLLQNPGW